MHRIIRRTLTITIRECWIVIWRDDAMDDQEDDQRDDQEDNPVNDLLTTCDESSTLLLLEKEQTNVAQENVIRTETLVIETDAAAEVDGDDVGGLPTGSS
jgi:hypothetical protein